jgi:sulfide:quinone oxidoreductase
MEHVFAAGDATAFPIKQGGLAAQQADAVAESIVASVGADVAPRPFRPVLRGLLMGGETARYMRARIATGTGDDCALSAQPLWWPPNRLCGRYLAPYLSSRVGGGAAMFQDQPATRLAVRVDDPRPFGELADLSAR